MARGPRRANIYAAEVDRSWMKWARCKLCGAKVCYNNFADHQPRIDSMRVRGVFLCVNCRHKNYLALELYLFAKELAAKKCKSGDKGCSCNRCRAREILERNDFLHRKTNSYV